MSANHIVGLAQRPPIEVVDIGALLAQHAARDINSIHSFDPDYFVEFVCDRLAAMKLELQRVRGPNQRDGGVDILFWPRRGCFPFLGAVQVKHHRSARTREGVGTVRDFAGVLAGHPFNAGLIVTNTGFTPDAQWFARHHARLLGLRGLEDLTRWARDDFASDSEWRDIPKELELAPGLIVKLHD